MRELASGNRLCLLVGGLLHDTGAVPGQIVAHDDVRIPAVGENDEQALRMLAELTFVVAVSKLDVARLVLPSADQVLLLDRHLAHRWSRPSSEHGGGHHCCIETTIHWGASFSR